MKKFHSMLGYIYIYLGFGVGFISGCLRVYLGLFCVGLGFIWVLGLFRYLGLVQGVSKNCWCIQGYKVCL